MKSNRTSASNRFVFALVIVAVLATIVGAAGFVRQSWLNEVDFRSHEILAIGNSMALTAQAAVEFQQGDSAQQLLNELEHFPQIVSAKIFDISGTQLATHTTAGTTEDVTVPANYGTAMTPGGLTEVAIPIESTGEVVGIIVLHGRQPSFLNTAQQFSVPLVGMVLVLSLGALTIGQEFHNRILAQSRALADTLKRFADEPNTSQRILLSDDEEFAEISYELNRLLERLDYNNQDTHLQMGAPAMLGVMYLNEEGLVDFCDLGAAEILGRSSSQVVGCHASEFLNQIDGLMISRILRDVTKTGRAYSFRASVSTTLGSTIPLHVSMRTIAMKDRMVFHVAMTDLHAVIKGNASGVQPQKLRRNIA